METQLQHGDVLLKKVAKLPAGASELPRHGEILIIMNGELTGHRHIITDSPARLWELKAELYLEVEKPVTITHEEHKPFAIPKGIYQIGQVQEHDYFEDQRRAVAD